MSNKANTGKSFKESIESVSKDIRYRKALVERFYFNNHKNYIAYYGWETITHVKMSLFMLSCVWIGYMIWLFLNYIWKDSSEWSYIETWAIYYVLFKIGYVYGYNTENWLRRVELGNYDRAILNEPGSSKENPIDLTNDKYETEKVEKEELTEDKKKKEKFEKEKEIAEIRSNLKRHIPEDEGEETVDDEAESTQNVSGVESVEI
jgi:hypothetical protein